MRTARQLFREVVKHEMENTDLVIKLQQQTERTATLVQQLEARKREIQMAKTMENELKVEMRRLKAEAENLRAQLEPAPTSPRSERRVRLDGEESDASSLAVTAPEVEDHASTGKTAILASAKESLA